MQKSKVVLTSGQKSAAIFVYSDDFKCYKVGLEIGCMLEILVAFEVNLLLPPLTGHS